VRRNLRDYPGNQTFGVNIVTDETPGMGDNLTNIDFAAIESERLDAEYAWLTEEVEKLDAEGKLFTEVIDADTKATGMNLVKRFRDEAKRSDGLHALEKMPHMRRAQAADQFFFAKIDLLSRRDKKNKEGHADRINRLITEYDDRIEAEIKEKARLVEEEARKKKEEAEAAAAKAEQERKEAELKASRARTEATRAAAEKAAQEAREAQAKANVEVEVTSARAVEARIETLRTPAASMRTRTSTGTLGTREQENFYEVTDPKVIDLEKLRPYLTLAALQQALYGYARSVGFSSDKTVQIKGATFGKRAKSRVR
jgi:hypothetical protein